MSLRSRTEDAGTSQQREYLPFQEGCEITNRYGIKFQKINRQFFQLEKHTQILLLILRLLVFLRDEDAAGKKQSVEVFLVVIVLRLKSW